MGVRSLPRWVQDQVALREAEEAAARRTAYDEWATHYADMSSSDPDAQCSCAGCNLETASI